MKKKNKLTIWDDEYTTALFGIIFFLLIVIGFGLLLNFIFGNKAAFVFQKKDGVYQMVLILDIFGYWTFPKGHKENEEEIEETIKREITEETGLKEVKIIKKLGERSYIAKDPEKGRIKRNVTDFLVEAFGNTELKIEKSPGIKDGKWFNIDEVLELKRYPDAEESFQKAISYLGENKI